MVSSGVCVFVFVCVCVCVCVRARARLALYIVSHQVKGSIIKDQLLDYLKLNNSISRQQHGFYRPFYVYTALRMFK